MIELGVNIDHVATLRQARRTYEPDPVWAAAEAQLGGADAITVHLREDRRHINDRDVELLKKTVQCRLNLEMSLAEEIVKIAVQTKPDQATLVPENRQEITTEGGLDVIKLAGPTSAAIERLRGAGIFVSAFIDAEETQVVQAKELGFDAVELHTGAYANASGQAIGRELERLAKAGAMARQCGLRLHAGHGLNYRNVGAVAGIKGMRELNIGHAIVSRAVFVGLRGAVAEMKEAIENSLRGNCHV